MFSINVRTGAENYVTITYDTEQGIKLDELYTKIVKNDYNIYLGKKHIELANGSQIKLLANKDGPAIPMFYYNKEHKYFTGEAGLLFLGGSSNRYMFIHRLTNNTLIPNLQIGISESAIAHNKINPLYYIPQYYVPYYAIKKLFGLKNDYNYYEDSYIGIDLKYDSDNFTVYGELLVDEYPYQEFATNPDKRAHLMGIEVPIKDSYWVGLEYSNVYAGVYEHRFAENRYEYLGEYIGHTYGPDTVEYQLELGINKKNKKYIFSFANIKNGPNDLDAAPNVGDGGILLKEIESELNEYSFKYQLDQDEKYYEIKLKYIDNLSEKTQDYRFYLKTKYKF